MCTKNYADDLNAAVRHALETTRAVAVCPFHSEVTIRVGDDAAESHAFERATRQEDLQERWHELGDASPPSRNRTAAWQSSRWGVPTLRCTLIQPQRRGARARMAAGERVH